mmetsp:Transcript_103974/g.294100  ORF Transcript_103974/g.294100 Transcript_103974/m.294100 type:complete len:268 (-) Transcript_103974:14-817(-)
MVVARPRKKLRRGARTAETAEAKAAPEAAEAPEAEAEPEAPAKEAAEEEEPDTAPDRQEAAAPLGDPEDKRGVVHLASVPPRMHVHKLRHLMEQFGEVGRIYLAPEEQASRARRQRVHGSGRERFTEGWIEFGDKKIARRVAGTLNGSPVGGKKRRNPLYDDMWNMKYLPKFKWYHLNEGTVYNRQVRKARLQQKIGQARRENDFFLEKVHQAKTQKRIDEKRARKGLPGFAGRQDSDEAPGRRKRKAARGAPGDEVSDRFLESLIW